MHSVRLQRAPAGRRDAGDRGSQAGAPAAARAADRHVPAPRVRRRVGRHHGVLVAVRRRPLRGRRRCRRWSGGGWSLLLEAIGRRALRVDLAPGPPRRASRVVPLPRTTGRLAVADPCVDAARRGVLDWQRGEAAGVLILVRHGRTALNAAGRCRAASTSRSTRSGAQQARRLAARGRAVRRADQQPAAAGHADGGDDRRRLRRRTSGGSSSPTACTRACRTPTPRRRCGSDGATDPAFEPEGGESLADARPRVCARRVRSSPSAPASGGSSWCRTCRRSSPRWRGRSASRSTSPGGRTSTRRRSAASTSASHGPVLITFNETPTAGG